MINCVWQFIKNDLTSWTKNFCNEIQVIDKSVKRISYDLLIIDDLGADSLDTVELIMDFEKAFGVKIPDDAAEKIATVGDAISYIESLSK